MHLASDLRLKQALSGAVPLFLAALLVSVAASAIAADARSVVGLSEGYPRVADGSAVITFYSCGLNLCGQIALWRDDLGARDEANRAPRNCPVCGPTILLRLQPKADGRWAGGRIYDPESGAALSDVSVQRHGSGRFAGIETWRRASSPARLCPGR